MTTPYPNLPLSRCSRTGHSRPPPARTGGLIVKGVEDISKEFSLRSDMWMGIVEGGSLLEVGLSPIVSAMEARAGLHYLCVGVAAAVLNG